MHAQPLVFRREFGVIAAPRATGIREHEDALLVIHEGRGLGKIGRRCTVLDGQTRRCPVALAHDPARAARDLRHHIRAEALDDLIERPRHGGKRTQLLQHLVAPRYGFAAFDRLTIAEDGA